MGIQSICPMNKLLFLAIFLSLLGLLDASFLTYEHFAHVGIPCPVTLGDCDQVLQSSYSTMFGVPLALIGVMQYALEGIALIGIVITNKKLFKYTALILSAIGLGASLYFVFLQLFVIGAICIYCMGSAFISTLLFIIVQYLFPKERKELIVWFMHISYTNIVKRLLFLIDPEKVHVNMTSFGETLGKFKITRWLSSFALEYRNPVLRQKLAGIDFLGPIGLAAGFDYEARITQISHTVSFGFQSVGTITNSAYDGNPRPMLGRLPKSKSLMVNKGYKNMGAKATARKLESLPTLIPSLSFPRVPRHAGLDPVSASPSPFPIPIGISIGRTNTLKLKTQKQSVEDIVKAFQVFEKSKVKHAYYELNISCPNLMGNITFYPPKNLEQLLKAVDKLHLSKPVFIKMPIEKTDKEILEMLSIIARHSPTGVIIGNLQKDRTNPVLHQDEVAKFPIGNFSGKPCFDRSNHLIALAYKKYKKRFIIIGCGGVFTPEDAYLKIKLGASLVQLITGMIFEGPQLIADINLQLPKLLEKDGYKHISEAVGTA